MEILPIIIRKAYMEKLRRRYRIMLHIPGGGGVTIKDFLTLIMLVIKLLVACIQ